MLRDEATARIRLQSRSPSVMACNDTTVPQDSADFSPQGTDGHQIANLDRNAQISDDLEACGMMTNFTDIFVGEEFDSMDKLSPVGQRRRDLRCEAPSCTSRRKSKLSVS